MMYISLRNISISYVEHDDSIPKVRQPGCRRRFARWQRTVGSSLSGNRAANAYEKWQPLSTLDM